MAIQNFAEPIPIFFSFDERFWRYGIVAMFSLIKNASKEYRYRIHVLHTDISEETQRETKKFENENFEFVFEDVTDYLMSIAHKLPLRDYYSKTTYYRMFIAEMHPEYDKAIYIDSDTIVQGDISELYRINIDGYYLAACHEQAMIQTDEFGTYVEKCIGLSRYNYFNAGVLLINCEEFRMRFVLDRFIRCLQIYDFVVTQDEDYLNLICKDHVLFIDQRWNTEVFGEIPYPIEEAKIVHYIMFNKPWHYGNCRFADLFYSYAAQTPMYKELLGEMRSFSDEQKKQDEERYDRLVALAVSETNNENNYLNKINRERSVDRVEIVKKIEEYEIAGRFDEDVENDPPGRVLLPEEIDYFRRGIREQAKTKMAFKMARKLVNRLIDEQKLIIKEIRGIEHFKNLQSGALITCNHFNAFDSFAIQLAYEASEQPDRTFFRVIREGNYTSFPGFYGFLMRHCNTLPLSSNHKTLRKFMDATDQLLKEGNFVLIYPEQSMWWNYRKPKPLKDGAFVFAVKNNVPVLPCFITMKDSEILGDDGFYVQEYTIHISEPIYPDTGLPHGKRIADLRKKNYKIWKEIYEREYQTPLTYLTTAPVKDLEELKAEEGLELGVRS